MQGHQTSILPEYKVTPRSLLSNLLILTASVGLVIVSVRLIHTKLTSVISRDAVINGTVININAPEDGTITELPVKTGESVGLDKTIITIKNDRISKLPTQAIITRINDQQAQLDRAQSQLERQLILIQTFSAEQQNQAQLEGIEAQNSVAEIESELQGAKSRYQIAQTSYNRSEFLRREGALAQTQLDAVAKELEESKNLVGSKEARLEAIRASQKASGLGLTLSRSRSGYDPRIRLQEMQLQIADGRKAIATLQQGIKDAKAELIQAETDANRKEKVVVKVPTPGVIWHLSVQPGQFVQQGATLGKVLDCKRRWVDVFVDEKAVRSIQPGTQATIELYGSNAQVLQGRVSIIRSGLGRLAAGEDVAVPITPNMPRNSQVRVDLEANKDNGDPHLMCYVGYTGRVTFKIN
jgi:multidrug resistance efflux pump